jgi:hypothetical protein
VMFLMKVVEYTPSLAKKNTLAQFVVIATRRSCYVMRGENALAAAITLTMFALK